MVEIKTSDLPESLVEKMEGPEPPEYFISNGCTMAPDFWGGVDIRPACHWHDFAYQRGGCKLDRAMADLQFYRNLRSCDLGKFMANIYYRRVRLFGVAAFNWGEGKVPVNPYHYFMLFWDRYIKW